MTELPVLLPGRFDLRDMMKLDAADCAQPSRCTVLKCEMSEKWLFMSVPSTSSITSCTRGEADTQQVTVR